MSSKPKILVARAIFPDILERLKEHAEVESNQSDRIWTTDDLKAALADKDGAIVTDRLVILEFETKHKIPIFILQAI